MIKISIIVAVYNCEKTLTKCIKSLLEQTYQNIEIILIDDGSKDKSGKICDEFSFKHNKISVIHSENNGVSSARNIGIQNAVGDYIGFVDSDDYVDKDMFLKLASMMNDQCSLAMCGVYNQKNIYPKEIIIMEQEQAALAVLQPQSFMGYVCNKLFKAKIIRDNNLWFDEKIFFGEDLVFVIQYLSFTMNNVSAQNIPLYHYEMQSNSGSFGEYNEKKITILNAYEIILKQKMIYKNPRLYKIAINNYTRHCIYAFFAMKKSINIYNKNLWTEKIKKIVRRNKFQFIFCTNNKIKYKFAAFFI